MTWSLLQFIVFALFVAALLGDRVLPSRPLTREDVLDHLENQEPKT